MNRMREWSSTLAGRAERIENVGLGDDSSQFARGRHDEKELVMFLAHQ